MNLGGEAGQAQGAERKRSWRKSALFARKRGGGVNDGPRETRGGGREG